MAHPSGLYRAGFVLAYGGGTASELHRLPWAAPAWSPLTPVARACKEDAMSGAQGQKERLQEFSFAVLILLEVW
jgi:hypothetical protein